MKYFLTLILYFIFLNLYSQNDMISDNTSIGFIFSPEYSNAVQLSGYKPKFAYSTGFNYQYTLSNTRYSILFGLLFTDRGYKEHLYNTNLFPVYDPNLPSNIKYTYNDHFLEIPVNFRLKLLTLSSQLSAFISGGISLNYLIYSTTITDSYYDNGNTTHNRQLDTLTGMGFNERFKLGGIIGFGLNCKLKNNLCLNIEPVYRYYIVPFSDMPSLTELNTVGINFGIFYTLKSRFKPLPH